MKGVASACVPPVTGRLLFDTGGSRSYVTQDFAKKVNAKVVDREVVSFAGFGQNKRRTQTYDIVELGVCLVDGSLIVIRASVAPVITCPVEKQPLDLSRYPQVASAGPLAEPLVATPSMLPIDVLVGNDFYYLFMNGSHVAYSDGMVFIPSKVGFLTDGVSQAVPSLNPHQLCTLLRHDGALYSDMVNPGPQIERFWELDSLGIVDKPSTKGEEDALKWFLDNVSRALDGRYQVRWPWKADSPELPDNKVLAMRRLRSLVKRLDADLIGRYHGTIQEQIGSGIIRNWLRKFLQAKLSITSRITAWLRLPRRPSFGSFTTHRRRLTAVLPV